ncbi:Hypothetical_protein [Hexamita inflata]|uniref:Hypothetical_protein n=1 Tax=Hexamita inflata TaxID=28002 RepID=A0AA86R3T5_9EUKA|nr:Hypothetical protein HINF_LOCUS52974 [Hexamita inflata]
MTQTIIGNLSKADFHQNIKQSDCIILLYLVLTQHPKSPLCLTTDNHTFEQTLIKYPNNSIAYNIYESYDIYYEYYENNYQLVLTQHPKSPFPYAQLRAILAHNMCLYTHAIKYHRQMAEYFPLLNNQSSDSIFLFNLLLQCLLILFNLSVFGTRSSYHGPSRSQFRQQLFSQYDSCLAPHMNFWLKLPYLQPPSTKKLAEVGLAYWYFDVHE